VSFLEAYCGEVKLVGYLSGRNAGWDRPRRYRKVQKDARMGQETNPAKKQVYQQP
jgi:hypothetical protein